jgi:hypothetical protein
MARRQGSEQDSEPAARPGNEAPRRAEAGTAAVPPGLPDLARRLLALGLSGVFATQETIRQAVGDALPKEWVDFAADQTERTRGEFLERLAGELARTLESIDLARVMQQALEGRTLEVTARIRMLPEGKQGTRLELSMVEDDDA